MNMARPPFSSLLAVLLLLPVTFGQQTTFHEPSNDAQYHFDKSVKRVAVIGAGVSGLQIAARLVEHNFTVRLLDRAPAPGGNWFYSEETPIRESYPDAPIGSYIKLPAHIPHVETYVGGEDGLSLDERWREHWLPRPIWNSLHTNSPAVITGLDEVPYAPAEPWVISAHTIQNHVRAYAAIHRLNPGDTPDPRTHSGSRNLTHITAYSTRVERLARSDSDSAHRWTLTLRHFEHLAEPARIKASWTHESFDAVVVATGGYDTLHVPEIPGIIEWSKVKKPGHNEKDPRVAETFSIYHSVHYRRPESYKDKTVIVVGPGTSGSEVARDIGPFVKKIYASTRDTTPLERRHPFQRRSIGRFPADKTEWIPEIRSLGSLEGVNVDTHGIKDGKITLINGTVITGVDEIILATGYKRRNAWLDESIRKETQPDPGLPHDAEFGKPPADVFNGKILRNLHWTGHYISDPTIVFANVRPWNLGQYQSLAIAKIFEGSAYLPSKDEMRKQYNPTQFTGLWGTTSTEALIRQYVTWLNNESLKYGGRLVNALPLSEREVFSYYANQQWEAGYITHENFTQFEQLGKEEWNSFRVNDYEQLAWEEGLDW